MDKLGVVKKLTDRTLGTQHVQRRMAPMPRHDRQFSLALRPPPQPDAPNQPPFVTQPSPRRSVAAVGQLTLRTTQPTHERADTVVYLDTPWWLCAARAFVRGLRRPEGTQLPDGCEDAGWRRLRDEWWLVWRVWLGRRSERERELAIVARHGGHAALHVLRSKGASREFLAHA